MMQRELPVAGRRVTLPREGQRGLETAFGVDPDEGVTD
jgi:hypothetical protein